jgi:hypothetical protein
MTGEKQELPSLDPVDNLLSKQADEIINEETTWVDLASQLDVAVYKGRDGHPKWRDGTPFRPVFLAYLWATTEGESLTGIPDRLENKPELARTFGFDPGDLPSDSTFRPVRITDRFSDLESTVKLAAERIRNIAAERGAPIGYDLLSPTDTDDEDSTPSKRTIQRLLRGTSKDVLDEMSTVAFPAIPLPRPDDPVYEDDELLLLECIAAMKRLSANKGGEQLGNKKNPDPDTEVRPDGEVKDEDPFYEDGPSGEVLLEAIKEMSVEKIASVMNFALRKTYTRAKPRLQELENDNGSRFGTRAKIALDITYVAYYGGCDEMKWVQGAPEDKGYTWCHKFATAVIVGQNTHYIVGVTPLGSTDYADTDAHPGKDNTYYIGDVTRRLLSIADDYVNIRRVYADREFYAADPLSVLEKRGLKYVIPAVKDKHRVRPLCDRFDELKRGYDEERDTPLYVKSDHPIHGPVKGEVTNEKVYTNLVVLPPDEDDDVNKEGSPQPFATNLDVSDELALDRRWAAEQIESYSDRGGIETSYSSVKEAAAWTTSKEFEVRWFHFAFGCVLYNMWLLVDFLTQERIGVIETRKKPRITLADFLDKLNDAVKRWLDGPEEPILLR